jgi:hypothetical protein
MKTRGKTNTSAGFRFAAPLRRNERARPKLFRSVQEKRGVTVDRQAYFDNADAALDLDRQPRPRYHEISLDSEPHRGAPDGEPQDEKGRPIVTLPDRNTDCDADLAGKSPDEIVEILERRGDDRDGNNVERLMQEFPGKSDGTLGSSSSSGKRHRKPRPPFDHTKATVQDLRDVGENRPHPVAGRVSTQALAGIGKYASRDVNVGTMLDALGRTLHAGASWATVEFLLAELRLPEEKRRVILTAVP